MVDQVFIDHNQSGLNLCIFLGRLIVQLENKARYSVLYQIDMFNIHNYFLIGNSLINSLKNPITLPIN